MNRIRKINFINHPVLCNLDLNFCDNKGKSVDTIIIVGENGCGKSTLIKELYDIATYNVKNELCIEVEHDSKIYEIAYKREYSLDIEGESDDDSVEILLHDKVLLTLCVMYLAVMFVILYL